MESEENVYCGGLKLYWTRMCESAEIYLVTQCREAKKENSKCIFFLNVLSPPHPQQCVPDAVLTLVIRNSEPCGSTILSIMDAALSPSLLQ